MKEFADDNFKFDENGRKLSKQAENIVGKGEIAHYEQFLLFPQCFQKACFPGVPKGVIVWEWLNSFDLIPNCPYINHEDEGFEKHHCKSRKMHVTSSYKHENL